MTNVIDMERVSTLIKGVAGEEILPRFRSLDASDIHVKSHPDDLVTEADTQAERALTAVLPDCLPGSCVVGEEAVYADPTLMDRLQGDDPVWIIDPVDGTANFARGKTAFACMVALSVKGQTVAGWIYDPLQDVMWTAELGGGAFKNGQRLTRTVDPSLALADMTGSIGPRRPRKGPIGYGTWLRYGSAAHDYMALAEGRAQFMTYSRLMPWDHAAGTLLYAETGGVVAMADQTPYGPGVLDITKKAPLILAQTPTLWEQVLDLTSVQKA